ncbi:MAG: methyltransferase domain-containing protein [Sphingomonadales bacterium]|nr:methyltransferase domain-containing protein [Sphingomonadales bacterium]
MAEAEFDAVAADYAAQHARSIRLSGEDTGYFARYKIDLARALADRRGVAVRSILDFGAGIGNSLRPLRARFPDAAITCLDVSQASLEQCRRLASGAVDFQCYDGETLPPRGGFDLVFTACVFHHIPAAQHVALLRQIRERLAPGGLFVLFEHNPWNPLTRHAVRHCPFDANAVLIAAPEMRRRLRAAGFAAVEQRYTLFFPGPLRALRRMEPALAGVPLGAQYLLAAQ